MSMSAPHPRRVVASSPHPTSSSSTLLDTDTGFSTLRNGIRRGAGNMHSRRNANLKGNARSYEEGSESETSFTDQEHDHDIGKREMGRITPPLIDLDPPPPPPPTIMTTRGSAIAESKSNTKLRDLIKKMHEPVIPSTPVPNPRSAAKATTPAAASTPIPTPSNRDLPPRQRQRSTATPIPSHSRSHSQSQASIYRASSIANPSTNPYPTPRKSILPSPEKQEGRGVWRDGRSPHGFPPPSPSREMGERNGDRRGREEVSGAVGEADRENYQGLEMEDEDREMEREEGRRFQGHTNGRGKGRNLLVDLGSEGNQYSSVGEGEDEIPTGYTSVRYDQPEPELEEELEEEGEECESPPSSPPRVRNLSGRLGGDERSFRGSSGSRRREVNGNSRANNTSPNRTTGPSSTMQAFLAAHPVPPPMEPPQSVLQHAPSPRQLVPSTPDRGHSTLPSHARSTVKRSKRWIHSSPVGRSAVIQGSPIRSLANDTVLIEEEEEILHGMVAAAPQSMQSFEHGLEEEEVEDEYENEMSELEEMEQSMDETQAPEESRRSDFENAESGRTSFERSRTSFATARDGGVLERSRTSSNSAGDVGGPSQSTLRSMDISRSINGNLSVSRKSGVARQPHATSPILPRQSPVLSRQSPITSRSSPALPRQSPVLSRASPARSSSAASTPGRPQIGSSSEIMRTPSQSRIQDTTAMTMATAHPPGGWTEGRRVRFSPQRDGSAQENRRSELVAQVNDQEHATTPSPAKSRQDPDTSWSSKISQLGRFATLGVREKPLPATPSADESIIIPSPSTTFVEAQPELNKLAEDELAASQNVSAAQTQLRQGLKELQDINWMKQQRTWAALASTAAWNMGLAWSVFRLTKFASGYTIDPLDPFLYHTPSTSLLSWSTLTSAASQWRPILAELPHWWRDLDAGVVLHAFVASPPAGPFRIPC